MYPHHLLAPLALAFALPVLASATITQIGCYSDIPTLKDQGTYTFQSQGYCEEKCQKGGFRIAALTGGDQCLCGMELPLNKAKVDDSKCNTRCTGWPEDHCGGPNAYTVLSTGEYAAVSNSNSDDSGTATASTAAGGIIVAPTNINPSSVPTGILTAPASMVSKADATAAASKSSESAAITSASASASASPTINAAGSLRAGSSVVGAVVAGLALLL